MGEFSRARHTLFASSITIHTICINNTTQSPKTLAGLSPVSLSLSLTASHPTIMELRRRSHDLASYSNDPQSSSSSAKASDPLPLHVTNVVFFTLFFSLAYYLLHRWRGKIRSFSPLHLLSFSDIASIFALIAFFIYLLCFFGIDFVQSFIATPPPSNDLPEPQFPSSTHPDPLVPSISFEQDEEIVDSVVAGTISSYSLESPLGNCRRATMIRREALQRMTGRSLQGLPLEGLDYNSIVGQCCEMPVGYIQVPVGAGWAIPAGWVRVHGADGNH